MPNLEHELEREKSSHKGQNGKVLVIGGSEKYTGAPALSAQASLRAGADLVKILTAREARPVVQGFSENLIVESYGEKFNENSLKKARELEEWADVTVVGPGLEHFDEEALKEFAQDAGKLVIDADAVNALKHTSGNIFTPHSGEAEALRQESGSVQSFASDTSNTVAVTGQVDKIFSDRQVFENETGCAGMTVGGTGDVLTGVVAGLKAQSLSDSEALQLGTRINGLAGEKAFEKNGNGLVATDLLERISEVLSK